MVFELKTFDFLKSCSDFESAIRYNRTIFHITQYKSFRDSVFDGAMDNNPVTIIVKASNQQFEDQTIRCELSWTIKRLKGLLSEVYPSKPVSIAGLHIF